MNQIANTYLFIGDQWSAINEEEIQKNNIKSILNASTVEIPINKSINYKQLFWEDNENQDISSGLNDGIQFIENSKDGNILIFCQAGRSRSGTVLIGYLMKKMSKSYEEVLQFVRKFRPKIEPNKGFERQLKKITL